MSDEKKCPKCLMMIPAESKKCPCCGNLFATSIIFKTIFFLLTILLIYGMLSFSIHSAKNSSQRTNDDDLTKNQTKPSKDSALKLIDHNYLRKPYGTRYISGTVKNESNDRFKYAQISFNLYDESGAQIGTAFSNINDIEPHGVWKFEALITNENASAVKFMGISGY